MIDRQEYALRLAGLWSIAQFVATVPIEELQAAADAADPERAADIRLLDAYAELQAAWAAGAPPPRALAIDPAHPHPAAECDLAPAE